MTLFSHPAKRAPFYNLAIGVADGAAFQAPASPLSRLQELTSPDRPKRPIPLKLEAMDFADWWTSECGKVPTERECLHMFRSVVSLYLLGVVTAADAAKVLEMRNENFIDVAAMVSGTAKLENAARTELRIAFNAAFPECDRRNYYRAPHGELVREYTDDELLAVPGSETDRYAL